LSGGADDRRVLEIREIPDAATGWAGRGGRPRRPTIRAMAIDIEQLIEEILRYLAAVDVFRSEACEPRWRS
jgi:hypothetical protein